MKRVLVVTIMLSIGVSLLNGQAHPNLLLTKQGIEMIRKNLGRAPIYDKSFAVTKKEVDNQLGKPIDVPVPEDLAGGYTHEVHRKNYSTMEKAGLLYQVTKDVKYAEYIKTILHRYAELYPKLGLHPALNSYARGKIFWQCLNDANWLVSVAQAYDCVYDYLSKKDRALIEGKLLIPFANFISIENPQFFNRIHNHATWASAGVGMLGIVINNKELIDRALYGVPGIDTSTLRDNDGGLINPPGQDKLGFLAQIDGLLSPDGLYSEGAYYHRYGAYPFLVFAASLHNSQPKLKIFEYRDSVLIKSVFALLNQTTSNGEFYPLNDAQKGMSIHNSSLISAVNIAYLYGNKDARLLSIAELQNEVGLDQSGMVMATSMKKKQPWKTTSTYYIDGANGNLGAMGILRSPRGMNLVFKAGSHGMGHGHFDQLSYCYYINGNEVVQDYGMARFVNIEQKAGGVYLPENTTFAKQTIAHNTIVVNQKSQFEGKSDEADIYAPTLQYALLTDPTLQGICAMDTHAYPGVKIQRTMLLIDDKDWLNPVLIDVNKVATNKPTILDLPLYYQGHIMASTFDNAMSTTLSPLGKGSGYQHIWKEGVGTSSAKDNSFTWLDKGKFHTYIMNVMGNDTMIFGRLGANDPNFNLRHDPVLIQRRYVNSATTFCNIIETHGSYSPVTEKATNAHSDIISSTILVDNENYTAIKLSTKSSKNWLVLMDNKSFVEKQNHTLTIDKKLRTWTGPFAIQNF